MHVINKIEKINKFVNANDMSLIYFSSETCAVCRDMLPKLKKILENYPLINSAEVSSQIIPEVSSIYGIFTAPAILLFIRGKETLREAGIMSLEEFDQKLARYYSLFFDQ